MLALARALVRRSKIIILDEPTASVDHDIDEHIQRTLRSEFKDSTVITIAHRLSTIMDYDRILVLEKGRIVEYNYHVVQLIIRFDTPFRLLERKGCFYRMVNEIGENLD